MPAYDSPGNLIRIAARRDVGIHIPNVTRNHYTYIALWPLLSTILGKQDGEQWHHAAIVTSLP